MAGLVKSRPFRRKRIHSNISSQFKKKIKLVYPNFNIPIQYIWIVAIAIVFIYWIFFVINNTLLRPDNYIQNISYGKYSVDMYDNPELYKKIWDLIRWENYFVVSKFKKREILSQLKSEFIMVKNITIVQPEKYGASVQLDFYEPDIVIKLWDKKFWVINGQDFEIFSGNRIWEDTFFVELPQYASGSQSIYWLFFEIPYIKFLDDMSTIADNFPNYKRIVYLPWASMTAVFTDRDQRVYINNQNSITWQIELFNNLTTFYKDASSLKIIDLWSLENNMIIVQ